MRTEPPSLGPGWAQGSTATSLPTYLLLFSSGGHSRVVEVPDPREPGMAKVPWAAATPLGAPHAGALGSAARPRPQGSASPTLSPSQPPSWFSCHVSHHVGAAGSLPGLLGSPVLVPGPPNSYAEA